jgi:hypothetical protein
LRAPSDQNGSLSPYGKKAAAGVSVASDENAPSCESRAGASGTPAVTRSSV